MAVMVVVSRCGFQIQAVREVPGTTGGGGYVLDFEGGECGACSRVGRARARARARAREVVRPEPLGSKPGRGTDRLPDDWLALNTKENRIAWHAKRERERERERERQ